MPTHYQPQGRGEGVYFTLSNDDYHNDPALSHSGMTKLLISWQDYWINSCHNAARKKRKQTDAMKFGERSGMLLLEPKRFHEEFNTYGRTDAKKKGGIWLSSVEYTELHESIDAIMEVPRAAEHFTDGYGEVSIFWRDETTGIMLRARIDYLRTFGAIDFKRIAQLDNSGIGRAVKAQGLDIQNFLYLEAIKAARRILGALKPKELEALAAREGVALDWLKAFIKEEELWFRFLFQRSESPYIWEFKELEDYDYQEGGNATFKAMKQYLAGLERFGLEKPVMGSGVVTKINSKYIPRRDYDYD